MSIGQGTVAVVFGWERNRRFGVALAMYVTHGRLCGISTNGLNDLRTEYEHPSYTSVGA